MFLQNLLNHVNILKGQTDGEHIELEIKIMLDPRIKKPTFVKSNNDIQSAITTIQKLVKNANQYGTSDISQTINFIKTDLPEPDLPRTTAFSPRFNLKLNPLIRKNI